MVVGLADTQLIESVAGFVDDGIHGACDIMQIIMRRNTDIVAVKIACKGMLCLRDAAVRAVDSQNLHQIVGQLALLFNRVLLIQKAVVDRSAFGLNAVEQGDDHGTQLIKEGIELLCGQSALIAVQKHLISRTGSIHVESDPAVGVDDLLQVRGKRGIIIGGLGLMPNALRLAEKHLIGDIFFLRHLMRLIIGTFHLFHNASVPFRELGLVLGQIG